MQSPRPFDRIASLVFFSYAFTLSQAALSEQAEPGVKPPAPAAAVTAKAPGQLSRWTIDPNNPEASAPTKQQRKHDPLQFGYWLMDVSVIADKAFEKRDYATAVKYYRALAKGAPEKSVAYTKMCSSYLALGDVRAALASCREALRRDGARVLDHARFLGLLVESKEELSAEDLSDVDAIFAHLKSEKVDLLLLDQLRCDVALRVEDERRLEECTSALSAKAPDDPRTISYQWSLAILRKDREAAEALIERARRTPMKEAGIRKMEAATRALKQERKPMGRYLWIVSAGLVVGLLALMARHFLRRFKTASA